MPENRVIIVVGPTCVGKTGLSALIAKKLGGEVVSADSMQIYRGMDIGTGKPTSDETLGVVHRLIDIIEPSEVYSAGRFLEDASTAIDAMHAKGRIPVVAGGTGLYVRAMTKGLFKGPDADLPLRDSLLKAEEETPGCLYERLQGLDPDVCRNIEPADTRRIVRALEVCLSADNTVTALRTLSTNPMPYEFIKIGLKRDRKELYAGIEARVDKMIERGLVEEVKRVLELEPSYTALQAIGYKEIAEYLRGGYSLDEAVRLVKRNTKRYAKRQFTWFNKEECVKWIDVTGVVDAEEMLNRVCEEERALCNIIYNEER